MERILLCVLSFSGVIGSSDLTRHYFYIPDPLTWTEAQIYCREKYTDLATIESPEEQEVLNNAVLSSGLNSEVWIGVYSEINWKWSDGYNNSLVYKNWDVPDFEPDFHSGYQLYVHMENGKWYDSWGPRKYSFVCYRGTQQDPEFIFVNEALSWSDAQRHCRENFIDLATVRNDAENQKIHLETHGTPAWIGLHRDPNTYWSDGTDFSYKNWANGKHPLGNMSVVCGAADMQKSGKWKLKSCDDKFPFVCQRTPVKKHVIKVRVKPKDTSVNLNDPAVKKDLLKKLEKKLTEKGLKGITLKWREQADGKVFHVERKSEKKNRKKTEL